jgi:tetratricopeptide (TPR) repeat protein
MDEAPPTPFDFKKRLRPKTYSVAVYIVGIFIVLQVVFLASVFWFRQTVRIESQGVAAQVSDPHVSMLMEAVSAGTDLARDVGNLPPPQIPGRLSLPKEDETEKRVNALNEDARRFRRENNFDLSEAALQKALALRPEHPVTLVNLAMLEEARGENGKALQYWQRVIALGPRADSTIRLARERAVILEERLRQERIARERESLILGVDRSVRIGAVRILPPNPGPRPTEVSWDIEIRALQGGLDPAKLRVQAFVYERPAQGGPVPARAEARFLNAQPSWQVGGVETLRLRYVRTTRPEERTYYGYLIRLVYDGKVQDERSEPAELLGIFPLAPGT